MSLTRFAILNTVSDLAITAALPVQVFNLVKGLDDLHGRGERPMPELVRDARNAPEAG